MVYELKRIVWEITSKCNMNCIHCGSDCKYQNNPDELTTEECIRVIEDLKSLGCELVFLSGGEPLLRKDIDIIIDNITKKGMKVAIVSNGYLVNKKSIEMLKKYPIIAYGISVDAADAYIHDYIRGKRGAFSHVINAIKLLNKNNILPSIVTTIHKLNYDQLPKIRDLLIENNVKIWQIQYADHMGRMQKRCKITEAQYLNAAKFILETRMKYKDYFINVGGADVFGYMSDFATILQGYWNGCAAGIKVIGLSSNGYVRGCLSMQDDKYIENNIRKKSLKDIWLDKKSFSYNRRFNINTLTGYCKECLYSQICKGGCMRSASLDGGRCTPYCLYRIEKMGFSSKEESKTNFSKEEIFELYNPISELPKEYLLKN